MEGRMPQKDLKRLGRRSKNRKSMKKTTGGTARMSVIMSDPMRQSSRSL